MARKSPDRKKRTTREDPDLLRRLFEAHEELQTFWRGLTDLIERLETERCPRGVDLGKDMGMGMGMVDVLPNLADEVEKMTRARRVDPKSLRGLYDRAVALRALAFSQLSWETEEGARWVNEARARLDRIVAALRSQ